MKKYALLAFFLLLLGCSPQDPAPSTLQMLEMAGSEVRIDNQLHEIRIHLGEHVRADSVQLAFSGTEKGTVEIGGVLLQSGDYANLVHASTLVWTSTGGASRTYTLKLSSEYEVFGMGKYQQYRKSQERAASYYLDQYGSGPHQYINCGPAVATMALKWSTPGFSKSILDARNTLLPEGGWWYTNTIYDYLVAHGAAPAYHSLPATASLEAYEKRIRTLLDQNHLVILCLDMFYVKENMHPAERTNRFYHANAPGWGHFVLVKGYTVIDGQTWLEVHDPYSIGQKYESGQLKGERRYYAPSEIKKATDVWWPHALVVPQQGSSVSAGLRTRPRMVPPQKGRGF